MSNNKYLVLGGCGFVGRSFIELLITQNLAEQVIAVDKNRPELNWMTPCHKACFDNEKVVYLQKYLVNENNIKELFEKYHVDYVINCAGESRYGMSKNVYEEHTTKLGLLCAKYAASSSSVKRFVQISNAEVYDGTKEVKTESSKIRPWTKSATSCLALEEGLKSIEGLNYVVLRPALCYGLGDTLHLTPRIVITAVYKVLGEKMKLLWTKDLRMSTVHVKDVAKAILHVCTNCENKSVYNLADKSRSDQGSLTSLIGEIFKVEHGFFGSVESNFAKLNLKSVVKDINEKHMLPWSEACETHQILNTPLSPYLDKELLSNEHLSINGELIESTGFKYQYPEINIDLVKEVVDDYINNKLFPPVI